MCTIVCDGRCRPGKSSSTGVAAAARIVVGAVWVTGRYVVWPTTVVAYRWLSGAPLVRDVRPLTRPAWLVRVRWSQWPRWQRATVRLAVTVLTVAGVLTPLWTALFVTTAAVVGAGVAVRQRHRRLAIQSGQPRRVTVKVGPPIAEARMTAGVW